MREVLAASRPFSWINTAYPFAAGMLVATQGRLDVAGWVTFAVGTLFFLVPYNLLMYGVNDVFDYSSDLANPRKGGIEGGLVAPERARVVHRRIVVASVATTTPFVVALLALGSGGRLGGVPPWPSLTLLVVVFGVVAYSAPEMRFKERPVLDSFTSAMHFAGPLLYALVLVGAPLTARAVWPAVVAFVVWGMASHAFGAVQDVRADRTGGIASVATALGARTTVRLVVGAYVLSAAALAVLPWPGWLAAVLPLAYAANAARFLDVTDDDCERANAGWRVFLRLNLVAGAAVTILLLAANH
ncbi:UbiA prenyltransferase [Beutenbergia cavernae DSM 12333]|uniref:UbiA prenyltransferase n=1 Tax=Beutenbergia cavernae (strain ATCC BAA-8 / DSM 12333 / CCUG 43141 / JCM 11478 / NBRC 16432 / NCIMB 13614 / HKI 0122) TaxID=471853 RepID=C5C2A5_BEUC1|nr:prenyltransferase [Beutenbergia cavernae]ACQ81730.1 UbiA prenyltransferase [Beutenbergia cavernae DSM 12333]